MLVVLVFMLYLCLCPCCRPADHWSSGERCFKVSSFGRTISSSVWHLIWVWPDKTARSTYWLETCQGSRVLHWVR